MRPPATRRRMHGALLGACATLLGACETQSPSSPDGDATPAAPRWEEVRVEASDAAAPKRLPLRLDTLPTVALGPMERMGTARDHWSMQDPDVRRMNTPMGASDSKDPVVSAKVLVPRAIPLKPLRSTAVKEPRIRENNPDCFSCFSKQQGLRHDVVHQTMQDREGNLWFATGAGAVRYDGHRFVHFGEAEGLPLQVVWSLLEARDGSIWLGGSEGTVCRMDGRAVTCYTEREGPLAHGITSMVEDDEGSIWIGSLGGGLASLRKDTLRTYRLPEGRAANTIHSIHMDDQGALWIGTRGAGLARLLGERTTWHGTATGLPNDTVRHVAPDGEGGLWICTNAGITHLRDERMTTYTQAHGLPEEGVRKAVPDGKGGAWFATLSRGFFHLRGNELRHFTEGSGLPINETRSLFLDRAGTLWVGSGSDGVCRYDGHRFRHWTRANGLPTVPVKSILAEPDGSAYIGTYDAGLWRFGGERFERMKAPGMALSDPITGLALDAEGRLWCALHGSGAAIVAGGSVRTLSSRQGLPSDRTEHVAIGRDGIVWLGTRAGLVRIAADSITIYDSRSGLGGDGMRFVLPDSKGRIWVSVRGHGLACLENGRWWHWTTDAGLPHGTVACLLEDRRGWIWIGTHAGIAVITPGGIHRLTEADGLCSNLLSSLAEDAQGNIVFGSRLGMGRITIPTADEFPEQPIIENFGYAEGFYAIGVNDGQTMARNADGHLLIATNTDLTAYYPTATAHASPPHMRLDGLSLFNENMDWTALHGPGHVRLGNGINVADARFEGLLPWSLVPQSLSLRHDNNFIGLHFTGVSTEQPRNVRYRWRLDGLEDTWGAPTATPLAQYGNLAPGSYTFLVQSVQGMGMWSVPLAYPFTIRPHWSATWWAYTSYVLVSLLVVLGYVRWRTAALKMRQLQLIRQVENATRDLRRQKERAEESERHKQQFLANMSHEIRTPMNAIMGMTGILKRAPHSPEQKTYLDAIAQSSENLLVILNDILDISKLEAGHIHLERVPFAPRPVLANVLGILRFRAEEKGLALVGEVDEAVPEMLLGDPTRLNQILLNLAGNAVKFTDRGSVRILMEMAGSGLLEPASMPHEGVPLVVKVVDTGIGIPADRLEGIFEEFTQAHSDTTRKYDGTGLGLTISKRLADLQGGSITVRSEVGKGSTFTVSVPYGIPTEQHDTGASLTSIGPDDLPPLRDLRILLAEDNAFNAMVAQDELADAIPGVQVDVAANGRAAVELAKANDYDVILMDVQMPEMNGYAATKAIRALPGTRGRVPILAMTANVMPDEVERCQQAGMDGFVPKPFKREQLLEAVAEAIRGRA